MTTLIMLFLVERIIPQTFNWTIIWILGLVLSMLMDVILISSVVFTLF